jgi:hypothetical protein
MTSDSHDMCIRLRPLKKLDERQRFTALGCGRDVDRGTIQYDCTVACMGFTVLTCPTNRPCGLDGTTDVGHISHQ